MANVVQLHDETTMDLPVERVLDGAINEGLSSAMVIGWTSQEELYLASSTGDAAELLLLLELAKANIMARFT